MNSNNDTIHTEIITSLDNQAIELKKLKGQYDASILSVYHAQGSYITAAEKLKLANDDYEFQKDILQQAITVNGMSTNVMQTATNAKKYVEGTVTNTAVAAANSQIAANAVVKLASHVGSIYSIINAADFDSEIFEAADAAYKCINETAYLAESVSQKSMEASALIAEVAISHLVSKVTATDTDIKNLVNTVTANFDNVKERVATVHQTLKSTSETGKSAEGNLENVHAIYDASKMAYQLSNKELNLAVSVSETKDTLSENHQYTVSFNPFTSAFKQPSIEIEETESYPVEAYYILLVKDSAKKVFSITDAKSIITSENDCTYIKIDATNPAAPHSKTISIHDLQDVNGDSFQLGDNYVVFIYAALSNAYKKNINVYEDYITAPSFPFSIRNHLVPAHDIKVSLSPKSSKTPNQQRVRFQVERYLTSKVEYRCVFLPVNALKTIANKNEKLGLCFDLMIAEMIPAGSYTTIENITSSKGTDPKASTNALIEGSLVITSAMTDNFGNRLIKGNTYIPVILSVSDDTENVNKTIINALSAIENTSPFTYKG